MTPMEIALLVVGVIIFALSFILPDTGDKKSEKQIEEEQEEIRKLMQQELDGMKLRVNEATNDSVDYAVDRAERSLERVSNEKIMAVNEYGQTIIEEINKNHQEVMFLYDMLKDKHTDLANSVRKADAVAKEMESLSESAMSASAGLKRELDVISTTSKGLTKEQKSVFEVFNDNNQETVQTDEPQNDGSGFVSGIPVQQLSPDSSVIAEVDTGISDNNVVMDMMSGTVYHSDGVEMSPVSTTSVERKVEKNSEPVNNNQRILELHAQGMPTVDIAKELKLGVGEVKLVIDLYQ